MPFIQLQPQYIVVAIIMLISNLLRKKSSNLVNHFLRKDYGFNFGVIKFNLPDLGEKIKEGTIKQLYIREGDRVVEFQKLADVASDKQFTEITATDAGVIKKIYYQEDQVCQVGDLFLEIDVPDTAQTSPTKIAENIEIKKEQYAETSQTNAQNSTTTTTQILASPFVRNLIKQNNLKIENIKATGSDGRITEQDVQTLISNSATKKTVETSATKKTVETSATQSTQQSPKKIVDVAQTKLVESSRNISTMHMTSFEKGMQKSMTESRNVPHLYYHEEFDISEAEKMRKQLKQNGIKTTLMGILIKTFSLALKKHPKINSIYEPHKSEFEYDIHPSHNISIAVDSPNGLVVPNLKNVQLLNLAQIQLELERLRDLSKEGKLTSKELGGGTICLSNIGTIGGTHANPLILVPQICIVAISKMQSLPKYRNGVLEERKVLNVSFGCDHRVIDGASVAKFSNEWKQLIEKPYLAMAQMI